MKGLILILERTWQLAWMFYFLRIVCFAYKGFHFPVNFDCTEDGAPFACWREDKSRVNCFEPKKINKYKEMWDVCDPWNGPSIGEIISNQQMAWRAGVYENGPKITRFIFSATERLAFAHHEREPESCDTDSHIYTHLSQPWKHGSGSGEPTVSAGMHRRVASKP